MRVPRGAYTWAASWLKKQVSIPVSATNRINTPELANEIIQKGHADLVSLARPFLADPHFVRKAEEGLSNRINTCIACNQACLDQIFTGETASCLVNPFAAREHAWQIKPCQRTGKIAVIGAGVAGCAAAVTLSQRGYQVEVFEKSNAIGGQFKLASAIPGKEEMRETLRYFENELEANGITLHFYCQDNQWNLSSFDYFVFTTGVVPKAIPNLESDHSIPILSYAEAIEKHATLGNEVVLIGSGGIAMDVASLLTTEEENIPQYLNNWGVDSELAHAGALKEKANRVPKRKVHFIQRSIKKLGYRLGKTTVWSHRTELADLGTKIHSNVLNMQVDQGVLHLYRQHEVEFLYPQAIVNCTGQESQLPTIEPISNYVVLGGAKSSEKLDAKRAIYEATLWALHFEL
jgi:2,4-dienoyl-CoA reductase (NADPH2)